MHVNYRDCWLDLFVRVGYINRKTSFCISTVFFTNKKAVNNLYFTNNVRQISFNSY